VSWDDDEQERLRDERLHRWRREGLRVLQTRRGDTLTFAVQARRVPPPQPNQEPQPPIPMPLAGCFVWFTLKPYTQVPDNQATCQITTATASTPPGGVITITNAVIGLLQVTAPPLATFLFPDGVVDLLYDVQVKDATGAITTVETGVVRVLPDVTLAIS
jgi:hypothetical protein